MRVYCITRSIFASHRNLSSYRLQRTFPAYYVRAAIAYDSGARAKVFHVWKRREVYAGGFARSFAPATNNLHNCAAARCNCVFCRATSLASIASENFSSIARTSRGDYSRDNGSSNNFAILLMIAALFCRDLCR